jgi:hypothetical protein
LVRGASKVGVAIALGGTIVLTGFGLLYSSQRAQKMNCASQLNSVSFAARLYSSDHQETFPLSIFEMSDEIVTPKVLICPADTKRRNKEHLAKISTAAWASLSTNDFTYEFLASGQPATNSNLRLLYCPIHQFLARADSRVVGRDGTKVPYGKLANE